MIYSNAVVSHVNLGKDVPQSSNVVNYVLSLVDSSSKLFANNAGGRGNIKSTYHAIATLSALDSLFVSFLFFIFYFFFLNFFSYFFIFF